MSAAATLTPEAFIAHWQKAEANERANSQSFLLQLTQMLGVPPPSNNHAEGYSFEFPVKVPGGQSTNFLDLYRRAHFVLESKQFAALRQEQSDLELAAQKAGVIEAKAKSGPVRGTAAWDDAMIRAKGQAERYVRYLPADEPTPPFIIVCDVGHSFEIYADFTQAGKAYLPFPDPRSFRIRLADLANADIRERLRLIWTNPAALDPAKVSADVTRQIAGYLAELAKSLEAEKHDPEVVAQFLTRCLFCMFAEDVGLLPERCFTELLDSLPKDGTGFVAIVGTLFREMNTGTKGDISVVLRKKLLRFNGGLFADDTVLPVNGLQLGLLKQASKTNWKNVEPAIFGTLLERALVPEERHALGAHFTPRAYVERLVLPTVVNPLREEWESIRAAAVTLANGGKLKEARHTIEQFHDQLCRVTVLDPACGSGNFLYVALEHLKRLEGEVLDFAAQFGVDMRLDIATHTVDPHQFLGIELNPRAAAIAELVLWIGYLQWHFRTRGQTMPEEPVLKRFKNIECRDAVLAYDGEPQPARDEAGNVITVWDRRSMKTDLVTNRDVPDESKRVPLLTYANPRPAEWPQADYIVGNPPFIGNKMMRDALTDSYTEALRKAYPTVPDSADFVMYWWHNAAELVGDGRLKRFGLITTNSIRQTYNRRVIQNHLPTIHLAFAIPDHPWVDTAEGAAVRIAMTVACAGQQDGELLCVKEEVPLSDGSVEVGLVSSKGRISADLTVGVDLSSAVSLKANEALCFMGVKLAGDGFVVTYEEAVALGLGNVEGLENHIRPFRNGRDLSEGARGIYAIDFFGLSADEVRSRFPAVYQHLFTRVKPQRDTNKRDAYRLNWWVFAEPRRQMRKSLAGLPRYIGTSEVSRHRFFTFMDGEVLADGAIIGIASDDAFVHGVLSSRIHTHWAITSGGRMGVGNDPRYQSLRCFDPFPFPLCGEAEKGRIREIAEQLDAHRKRVQAQHPHLTLTGMYNVLEKLRGGTALTDKERRIHDDGLVSVLLQLHEDLDEAVFAAYGWQRLWQARKESRSGMIHDLVTGEVRLLEATPEQVAAAVAKFEQQLDAEILQRLVTLNAQRAEEERRGIIHWLRPEYQNAAGRTTTQDTLDLKPKKGPELKGPGVKKPGTKTAWPKPLAERIRATEQALHAAGTSTTAEDLAKQFARAKPEDLQEILESLVTLGRARRDGEKFAV